MQQQSVSAAETKDASTPQSDAFAVLTKLFAPGSITRGALDDAWPEHKGRSIHATISFKSPSRARAATRELERLVGGASTIQGNHIQWLYNHADDFSKSEILNQTGTGPSERFGKLLASLRILGAEAVPENVLQAALSGVRMFMLSFTVDLDGGSSHYSRSIICSLPNTEHQQKNVEKLLNEMQNTDAKLQVMRSRVTPDNTNKLVRGLFANQNNLTLAVMTALSESMWIHVRQPVLQVIQAAGGRAIEMYRGLGFVWMAAYLPHAHLVMERDEVRRAMTVLTKLLQDDGLLQDMEQLVKSSPDLLLRPRSAAGLLDDLDALDAVHTDHVPGSGSALLIESEKYRIIGLLMTDPSLEASHLDASDAQRLAVWRAKLAEAGETKTTAPSASSEEQRKKDDETAQFLVDEIHSRMSDCLQHHYRTVAMKDTWNVGVVRRIALMWWMVFLRDDIGRNLSPHGRQSFARLFEKQFSADACQQRMDSVSLEVQAEIYHPVLDSTSLDLGMLIMFPNPAKPFTLDDSHVLTLTDEKYKEAHKAEVDRLTLVLAIQEGKASLAPGHRVLTDAEEFAASHSGFCSAFDPLTLKKHTGDRLFFATRAARDEKHDLPCVQIIAYKRDGVWTRGVFAAKDLPRFAFITQAEGRVETETTVAAELTTFADEQIALFRRHEVPLQLASDPFNLGEDGKIISAMNDRGSVEPRLAMNPSFFVRKTSAEEEGVLNCTFVAWASAPEFLSQVKDVQIKQATQTGDLKTILVTTREVKKGEELVTISWKAPLTEIKKRIDVQTRFMENHTFIACKSQVYHMQRHNAFWFDLSQPAGTLQNTFTLLHGIYSITGDPAPHMWAMECAHTVARDAANMAAVQHAGVVELPAVLPYTLEADAMQTAVAMLRTRSGQLEDLVKEQVWQKFLELRPMHDVFVRVLFRFDQYLYDALWDLASIPLKAKGLPRAMEIFKAYYTLHFSALFGPSSRMSRTLQLQFQRLLLLRYKRSQLEALLRTFCDRRIREYKNQQGQLYMKVKSGEMTLQKRSAKQKKTTEAEAATTKEEMRSAQTSDTEYKAGVRGVQPVPDGKQSSASEIKYEFVPAKLSYGEGREQLVDNILAYMLATFEPVPASLAHDVSQLTPAWFTKALQLRIAQIEKRIAEHKAKIVDQRSRVMPDRQPMSVSEARALYDAKSSQFGGYYTPKPSKEDLVLVDFLHHQSALLARMKALLVRLHGTDAQRRGTKVFVINDMKAALDFVMDRAKEGNAPRSFKPLLLNVARDEYGNVVTMHRTERKISASTDVKDGGPAANQPAPSVADERSPVYVARSDMLTDLQNDLDLLEQQIGMLLAAKDKDDVVVINELQALRRKHAEVLEMMAEVHMQTEFPSPPMNINRSAKGMRADHQKWVDRDATIRKEVAMRWDRGGATDKAVTLIEEQLTMRAVKLPEEKTIEGLIAAMVKVWLTWDAHIRPLAKDHPELKMESIPRGSLRHYFLNYEHLLRWLRSVFKSQRASAGQTATAFEKAIGLFESSLQFSKADTNSMDAPAFVQLRSNRSIEHCVQDQLFIMVNLSHALVNRYRVLRGWITSAYFATLPASVMEEQTHAILNFAHGPIDESLLQLQSGAELKSKALEEASAVWSPGASKFSSVQAAADYNTRQREMLQQLTKFNRRVRLWMAWLYDVTEEFYMFKLVQENKLAAPMDLQLMAWDNDCKMELVITLTEPSASPFTPQSVRKIAKKFGADNKERWGKVRKSINDDWSKFPNNIKFLLPVQPLVLISPTTLCAWGMTAAERGDYVYMDFTRAHLMTRTPAKAFEGDQGYAYARLVAESSSPTAFARKREMEDRERQNMLRKIEDEDKRSERVRAAVPGEFQTDKQQSNVMYANLAYMLGLEADRNQALQIRFNILAKVLALRTPKKSKAAHLLVRLSGTLHIVDDEWNSDVIPDDMRATLRHVSNEVVRLSTRLADFAAIYRLHAEQLKLPMTLDPITIRHSMASFQIRLQEAETMYAFLTETGRNPVERRHLGNTVIPEIRLRLKERSNLWHELPPFVKRLVGESPPECAVKFVLDIATLREMLAETADVDRSSS